MPMMSAQRTGTLVVREYIPGEWATWVDGKPPHGFGPGGEWVSLVAGVNPGGDVVGGRNPATGLYAPGDSYIGNRPVYYNENGIAGGFRPYMDPDGFSGKREDFAGGFGGTNGSVYIAPPVTGPITAPVPVYTAPHIAPVMYAADDGSRAAAGVGDMTDYRGATPPPAPARTFVPPPVFVPSGPETRQSPEQLAATALANSFAGGYFGAGRTETPMLNANRDAQPIPTPAAPRYLVGGQIVEDPNAPPQILPTNNTTATPDAKKKQYLIWAIVALVVLALAYYLTHRKGS